MIRFGTMSFVLAFGVLQGFAVAALLLRAPRNRVANRFLAAFVAVLTLRLVPDVIGFAGFYDAYPWLSFAPFELSLWYGPLIYLYVARLLRGALPPHWRRHLLAGALQFAYYAIVFALPLAVKNGWHERVQARFVDPLETVVSLVSFGTYLVLAWRELRERRRAASPAAARWLGRLVAGTAAMLVAMTGFAAFSALVHRLGYFGFFPLYVGIAMLVYALALDALRHAGDTYRPAGPTTLDASDGRSAGERYRDAIAAGGWWREPDLALATAAERLDVPAAQLSRALNDGLGQSFSEVVNRLRVDAVAERLHDPAERADVLSIALDAGFASKASFNRAFKAYTGTTPTAVRRARSAAPSA